jgi:DNA-binding LytR/AlgR family response regulator
MFQSTEKTVRAVLVEDEAELCAELREALAALWPELLIVGEAGDGASALNLIEQQETDVVFLDIQIPGPNGLELARLLGDRVHVVFVTAYDSFAIEAFERGAVDYILKPVGMERLALTVKRLKQKAPVAQADLLRVITQVQGQNAANRHLRWITAIVGRSMRLIAVDDIVFFQSEAKYTRAVLADSEVLLRKTLKDLVAELDPDQFWQVHRSTVVNALEIAALEPNLAGQPSIRLRHRTEQLPVSESFVRRFRQM